MAEPIILVLFERGAFTSEDTLQASYSLIALAIGLVAFMLIKVLTPSFFARQEPKKPMIVALGSMILNGVLAWIFGFYLGYGHIGLAIASSVSAFFTVITLLILLRIEEIYEPSAGWLVFWLRLLFAAILLIVWLVYFDHDIFYLRELTAFDKASYLLKMVIVGILIYLLALRVTGLKIKDFLN